MKMITCHSKLDNDSLSLLVIINCCQIFIVIEISIMTFLKIVTYVSTL